MDNSEDGLSREQENNSEDGLSREQEKKIVRQSRIVELRDRVLLKDRSADRAVMEEVFDKSTLMVVYGLLNQEVIKEIFGVMKSGKESRIYTGIGAQDNRIAIKIYLTTSAEFKKGMIPYITGDPRFKVVKRDSRSLAYLWAQKEFKNLQRASEVGIRVPRPIHVEKNILVMEFITEDDYPAQTLKEKHPKNPRGMYRNLLKYVRILYRKAKLVHGDLSEYNIMNLHGIPVIFDMSQSVHIDHPMAKQLLQRDIDVLNRFFKKLGVPIKSSESIYEWVVG
ncbi:MAG: serine protein kinase RIO [Candidatus Bathyarchaeota archaeon]